GGGGAASAARVVTADGPLWGAALIARICNGQALEAVRAYVREGRGWTVPERPITTAGGVSGDTWHATCSGPAVRRAGRAGRRYARATGHRRGGRRQYAGVVAGVDHL